MRIAGLLGVLLGVLPAVSACATDAPAVPKTTPPPIPLATLGEEGILAYVTGYSYVDNSPGYSAQISNPLLHATAGGTGTYEDPITVAVGHSIVDGHDTLDWPTGTRFYLPDLRRYLIVEDTCGDGDRPQDGPCHVGYPPQAQTWLNVWIGGQDGSIDGSRACLDRIQGLRTVLWRPASDHPVDAGPIYGAAGCAHQYGD